MSTPSDGGPAFPSPTDRALGGEVNSWAEYGMTLREWFAGQALVGELASSSTQASCESVARAAIKSGRTVTAQIAFNCYEMADAMLAERVKRIVAEELTRNERDALKSALEPFLMSYSIDQLEQLASVTNGLGEIGPKEARLQLQARAAIGAVEARGE